MNKNNIYNFPESNMFRAREVLDLDFDIDEVSEDLYVNLDAVRIDPKKKRSNYFRRAKIMLNINPENDKLEQLTQDYVKIIFSGHRGSGKTLESRRMNQFFHNADRYFSIFIEIEKESEISKFQSEDYLIWIITKLARDLEKANIKVDTPKLDAILRDWLDEKEITQEVTEEANKEKTQEENVAGGLFKFFKFKFSWKNILATKNKTSEIVRQKIKRNSLELVHKLNEALAEIRQTIQEQGKGQDILFIIDGSEKVPYEAYEKFFIQDHHIVRGINCNMLISVRLDTFFNINAHNALTFFEKVLIPMVKLKNSKGIEIFSQIISKRIHKSKFFEDKVLEFFVEKSGGSIRQLLRIVRNAILDSEGVRISMEDAQYTVDSLGSEMLQVLTTDLRTILLERKWESDNIKDDSLADLDIATLIQQLILLKYNGHIEINPLIADKFTS